VKVLVVGSGGREHAIAWRLSSEGADVHVAPGNGGTSDTVPLQPLDLVGLGDYATREGMDLTIVGPEAPLAAGLVDHFTSRGLQAFGPTRAAARLEWSKAWTKEFLRRNGIPTGAAQIAVGEAAVRRVLARVGLPAVLKADGLAAGKGVFVVRTREDVDTAVDQLFNHLSEAAHAVLVEEYMEGPELSVLAFTDGDTFALMPPARDYKRLLDHDRGPNTGGMGGYTRPTYASPTLLDEVQARVIRPTLEGMQSEGHAYRGVLYAGLMLTSEGPKVLEFNSRFGDPECQLILPLLESSLGEACNTVVMGALKPEGLRWRDDRSFGVVLAARGYPDAPVSGDAIGGLDHLPAGVTVFHAATRAGEGGRLLTAGGRVLTVVGPNREAVYAAANQITFEGKQFRTDIGVEVQATVGAAR
jgi:phosphoribosylamine--glycine ligase